MSIEQPLGGSVGGDANTITDRQLFDHANADPAPATPPAPPPPSQSPSDTGGDTGAPPPSTRPDLQQQPEQQQQPGQPRAPDGKFAPKPQGQPQQRQPEDHRVPLRELLAERDARQRLEAHAAELTRAVMELQRRFDPQQPQQPQGPENTIFDDTRAYLDQNVMQPLRQEGQMYMAKVKDDMSRVQANRDFGEQEVNAALGAMQRVRHTPQGTFAFQQIMSSGHPYGELVKWHRQAAAMAAIGADPHAWLKQQQEKWLDDPNAQRMMMERLRARQQQNGAQGNPPNVQLPPSLSSVASTANRTQEPGDLSSQSLWSFANR